MNFVFKNIRIVENIRISPEPNVRTKQIAWNPVQNNLLAVCFTNGLLATYNLLEKGFEIHLFDKPEYIQSLSWSPKGKQILAGAVNGKLMQFKPDLKLTRTMICPPEVFGENFDCIAVYWLFNYQYATVFLERTQDATPCIFIVNAPKAGNPMFIKYDDICYSQPGPRKGQVFLINIPQWNILLMASANSMEVGILGVTENSENPIWAQWITTDEARAELPLIDFKIETFPIGFCLETGCTQQLAVGESKLPKMPMVHLLSTHGYVVSFNLINLKQNYVDICSPPRNLENVKWTVANPLPKSTQPEISFALPSGSTSTPAQVIFFKFC